MSKLLKLAAEYQISPGATREDLLSDLDNFVSSAAGIFKRDNSNFEDHQWGALYLLEMAESVLAALQEFDVHGGAA
ncbi:MAG: hypothetical protein AB1430_09260 [Pseudomonadota bacterium]